VRAGSDLEHDRSFLCADRDRRAAVLADAFQRLYASAVDGAQGFGGALVARGDLDRRVDPEARSRRAQRSADVAPLDERRVDPLREPRRLFERLPDVTCRLLHELLRPSGIGVDERARELQVDGERDEVLLDALVQRALDAVAFRVAGEHESSARGAQLLDLALQALDAFAQLLDVLSLNEDTRGR
jgi:hypothetical protein